MMRLFRNNWLQASLLMLVGAAFVFGGSPRADVASLVLLRPLSMLVLAVSVAALWQQNWLGNRAVLVVALAWFVMVLIHLVPLPPGLWQSLPGRELAMQIDVAVGLDVWRPISLVPWRTLNAAFALCLPLAVLVLTLGSDRSVKTKLIYLLLGFVALSAAMGVLQIIGGAGNVFYTYRVTNSDSAVGLLANRNHHAIFLSLGFPILAAALALAPASAENIRLREWAGAGIGLLLIPVILTTQSRAGIIVALLCMGLAWWVYRSPIATAQQRRRRVIVDPRLVFGGLAAVGLVTLTTLFAATNAFERVLRVGREDDEMRLQIWPVTTDLANEFAPIGSGIGTFVEIFQTGEPAAMLQPSFVNHAHNDWLEIYLTGGLPALAIVVCGIVVVGLKAFRNLSAGNTPQDKVITRLGISIIAILAIASLYDYPLRTPALAALLAAAVAMAVSGRTKLTGKLSDE